MPTIKKLREKVKKAFDDYPFGRIGGLHTVSHDIEEGLERIVDESKDSPNPMGSTDDLVRFILGSLVDGFNRPGSWERTMLEKMGLI